MSCDVLKWKRRHQRKIGNGKEWGDPKLWAWHGPEEKFYEGSWPVQWERSLEFRSLSSWISAIWESSMRWHVWLRASGR